MTFRSILFKEASDRSSGDSRAAPAFFVDLGLDQIVAAVTAGKEEYDLTSFFHMTLHDADSIAWRHEVMRDLENADIFDSLTGFAQSMRKMRESLARSGKLYYELQKQRWFLDAIETYCNGVKYLVENLPVAAVASRGLLAFREYLAWYTASERFTSLFDQTKALRADLSEIVYTVLIDGGYVEVGDYQGEADYTLEVESTFEKFKQDEVSEYSFRPFDDGPEMNHVEARILELVAKRHQEVFSRLAEHCAANRHYLDDAVAVFDREIQFYVAYLEHVRPFKQAGLSFCYPQVGRASKEVYDCQSFDFALARKLVAEHVPVICNDFYLEGRERIIVVSGPNQGGKTTFARTFGQLHYLAALGFPVPGTRAQLYLFDRLFTHFEREEHIANLRGKLEDDLVRIHDILARATPDSIVIMNEIFTATTLQDAIALSRKIAEKLLALDLIAIWVTFLDELAALGEETVSMVSTVVPDSPATRTYKVIRRPADGLAYALSIAEKYRLTERQIRERVGA